MSTISNLKEMVETMAVINAAKTAPAETISAVTAERLKIAKDSNEKIAVIREGLKASGMGAAATDALMASMNLKEVDLSAEERRIREEVQQELDAKATQSFYEGLSEASMLLSAFGTQEEEKSPVERLVELQILKLTQELAGTPTPVPVHCTAQVTTPVPETTPAIIQSRKALTNELRAISASARADRAQIHADSIEHPLTGGCKRWGSSIFEELAERARARSEYWRNK